MLPLFPIAEFGSIVRELVFSSIRLLSIAAILGACFYFKAGPTLSGLRRLDWRVWLLLLAEVLLTYIHPKQGHEFQVAVVYAATSLIVAVREELVYRYVLQTWLVQWLPKQEKLVGSVLITSVVFTLMHFGVQPVSSFGWIFVASVLLCLIYHFSKRNLALVIATHFLVDAYISFS